MRRVGLVFGIGIVLIVGGCAASIRAYDEKYIYDSEARGFWDAVSLVGGLAVVVGLLAILGAIVAAIVRAIRGPRSG